MFFFVPKQGSKMRHTIKEQKEKYQDAEREVSLFYGKIFTAYADVFAGKIRTSWWREMNKPSTLEIKLVDKLFDKEALHFLKETWYLQYRELMVFFFFLSFFSFFLFLLKKKKKRTPKCVARWNNWKQRSRIMRSYEHELSLKRTPGREE